nr:MAG TPA: hypothetical protein [Inoviridae sp.]
MIRPCISTGPTCQNTYYNLPLAADGKDFLASGDGMW